MPRFLQMARLRVQFAGVEHGWLQTLFWVEEQEHFYDFSYVLSDALPNLCDALRILQDTDGIQVITWMTEPDEHEMRFIKQNQTIDLQMWRFRDHKRGVGANPVLEFLMSGSDDEICLPFWRALLSLSNLYSTSEFDSRWRRPFPVRELALLTTRLGKA